MAIKKVTKEKAEKKTTKKAKAVVAKTEITAGASNYAGVIIRPRITEKAAMVMERDNAYTFEVSERSTKQEVEKAILALYKVKPLKINITPIEKKNVIVRGKKGVRGGGKKAVVYLKKEDKIEFI